MDVVNNGQNDWRIPQLWDLVEQRCRHLLDESSLIHSERDVQASYYFYTGFHATLVSDLAAWAAGDKVLDVLWALMFRLLGKIHSMMSQVAIIASRTLALLVARSRQAPQSVGFCELKSAVCHPYYHPRCSPPLLI